MALLYSKLHVHAAREAITVSALTHVVQSRCFTVLSWGCDGMMMRHDGVPMMCIFITHPETSRRFGAIIRIIVAAAAASGRRTRGRRPGPAVGWPRRRR